VRRGRLRIYLGAAPGVGKTYDMLNEGRRRAASGTDVVIGFVEAHGREGTLAQVADLEIVPRQIRTYRGVELEEMDLDAVVARKPDVALVDELAHTNVPGSKHQKRWEDVHTLLDAGIDVITTVNVQHLESLNDVVETITGIRQAETVPDWVVRDADQVELTDLTPEALRRRMAEGNVYAADKVDAALANYFRPGNLAALRELALLWVADKVDEALQRYMDEHQIAGNWETRERVVVAITGAPGGDQLIRRAARMAQRSHGELIGVHVKVGEGLARAPSELLEAHRRLLGDLGGEYHEVVSGDVADGIASFARSVKATQMVMGSSRRSRWTELLSGSIINRVIRLSGDIDVHVISYEVAEPLQLPQKLRLRSPLSRRRQAAGWIVAAVGLTTLTAVLYAVRDSVDLSTVLILYLLLVCVVAAIGGLRPALGTALAAAVAGNWFFTQPHWTLVINDAEHIVAVVVFVAAGVLVSLLVGQSARRSAEAHRARAEAGALAAAAGHLSAESDPLSAMLAHVRVTFGQQAAAILETGATGGWTVAAVDGSPVPEEPGAGESFPIEPNTVLCLVPGQLSPDDRRLLDSFTARLADAVRRRTLEEAAAAASARDRADELRTAILRAVSHDLRSPLASIKASSSSLLQDDIEWSREERREFAETIDEEADRLDRLVTNLLDMSRIEAGAVQTTTRAVSLEEVIGSAVANVSGPTGALAIEGADDGPAALADPGLLERVVANVIANALEHSPPEATIRVETSRVGQRAVLRVVDRGEGIDPERRDHLFEPFQRVDDSSGEGVGLGLAVARGFMEAMSGHLTVEDTPGGGLTVTLVLPLAEPETTPASSPMEAAP
jgi:two-component system, OmpR family, sensor histidine kinase KdpD